MSPWRTPVSNLLTCLWWNRNWPNISAPYHTRENCTLKLKSFAGKPFQSIMNLDTSTSTLYWLIVTTWLLWKLTICFSSRIHSTITPFSTIVWLKSLLSFKRSKNPFLSCQLAIISIARSFTSIAMRQKRVLLISSYIFKNTKMIFSWSTSISWWCASLRSNTSIMKP